MESYDLEYYENELADSAGNKAAPGYIQLISSRDVSASAEHVLKYSMNIQDLPLAFITSFLRM
jgi:hypothetical protein